MVTIRPPKTIVKPTALGPVANTDTKLLIYGLFQKGRVLAQDGVPCQATPWRTSIPLPQCITFVDLLRIFIHQRGHNHSQGCLCRLLLVMCTHPFAKKELTLH